MTQERLALACMTSDMIRDAEEEDEEEELAAADAPLLGPMPHQQVQRPRLLICGQEGAGQSHLGPALLYALEGLPVHALGLPSLLSDASARSVLSFTPCLLTSQDHKAAVSKQPAACNEPFEKLWTCLRVGNWIESTVTQLCAECDWTPC